MDTIGAVLGPALALAWLAWRPGDYTTLFLVAFAPGVAAILLTMLLRERPAAAPAAIRPTLRSFLRYWQGAPQSYRRLVIGVLPFALFNSSDIFLLMKVKEAGVSDTGTIGVYIFYNLVYALSAYPLGRLADRIGLKRMFLAGLIVFCGVYVGMSAVTDLWMIIALFAAYGVYAAATEGVVKAWICVLVPQEDTATAVGTFSSLQSVGALVASVVAGALWVSVGSDATFLVTALMAVGTIVIVGKTVRT
jgi:MFS family permease